jgi:hypothetical protein
MYRLFSEDVDTSLSDYFKALAILEQMAEPDHRRIVELYPLCVFTLSCMQYSST